MNYEPYTDDYLCAMYDYDPLTGVKTITGYITQAEALKIYNEPLNNEMWLKWDGDNDEQ